MSDNKTFDAGLDLLDRQVLDVDGVPVGKVDDVELSHGRRHGDPPEISALLLGPIAYGHRLGGRIGSSISGAAARLRRRDEPVRVPVELIKSVDVSISLAVEIGEIDGVESLEQWLQDHVIGRIPGAGHATE